MHFRTAIALAALLAACCVALPAFEDLNVENNGEDSLLSSPDLDLEAAISALDNENEPSADEDVDVEDDPSDVDDNAACPTDPRVWGGPGQYCYGMDLVACSAPGTMPTDIVESCVAGCINFPLGVSDACVPSDVADASPAPGMASDLEEELEAATGGAFTATPAFMECLGVSAANAPSYASALTQTLAQFKMTDPHQIQIFLGNCAVESANWATTTEYGNKLCRGYSGGCNYKGRGIIQITHDFTYNAAGKFFGQPFLKNPNLVAEMPWAFLTAGWFWTKYKSVPRCFTGAHPPPCDAKCAAAFINGYFRSPAASCGLRDPNGWAQRQAATTKAGACMAKMAASQL